MARLEEVKSGSTVKGLAPGGAAKVVQIEWYGDQAAKITFEDSSGRIGQRIIYRADDPASTW